MKNKGEIKFIVHNFQRKKFIHSQKFQPTVKKILLNTSSVKLWKKAKISQHYDDANQLLKDKTPKSQNYQWLSSLGNGQTVSSSVIAIRLQRQVLSISERISFAPSSRWWQNWQSFQGILKFLLRIALHLKAGMWCAQFSISASFPLFLLLLLPSTAEWG